MHILRDKGGRSLVTTWLWIAGRTEEDATDASQSLKPALARGDFLCIGATTYDEYTKYIEKDQALARRFQKVVVDPPSASEAISILRGLKTHFESHHGISIADAALIEAVKLSERYIPDRFLPDKGSILAFLHVKF